MKLIVFVTVCAFALNLLFDDVNSELRSSLNDLTENPLHSHNGTRNAHRGNTFMNTIYDAYPRAPLAPKSPQVNHTMEFHLINDTSRNVVKINCYSSPRHPHALNSECVKDIYGDESITKEIYGDESPVTINADADDHPRRPHGPGGARANPTDGVFANVNSSYVPKHPHVLNSPRVEEYFPYHNFSRKLIEQQEDVMASIAKVWLKCNESLHVPLYIAMDFFSNPPDHHERDKNNHNDKRLVDCTLRGMGVINDEGFQEETYLIQIRKLLFNYTSFDVNARPKETKETIWIAGGNNVVERFHENESCFPIGNRLKKALKSVAQPGIPDAQNAVPAELLPDLCHELLQSYEQAVHECKNRKDPKGKSFETTWMIVLCVAKGNMDRMFDAAFYPGVYASVRYAAGWNFD
ncbi:hypothetical protein HA402_014327 [Bradysia odoriphaga]|nr:hypothetical protein HA402_014327 [Bradysia odoriphaga]